MMELDKELAETVDHACQVGGNGYYMRRLLEPLRNEHKALQADNEKLRAIVSGADISRSTLVSEVSGLTDDVERLETSLNRATQSMADKDKQIAKLKKKKGR